MNQNGGEGRCEFDFEMTNNETISLPKPAADISCVGTMLQRQRFDGWRCNGPGVAFNVSEPI